MNIYEGILISIGIIYALTMYLQIPLIRHELFIISSSWLLFFFQSLSHVTIGGDLQVYENVYLGISYSDFQYSLNHYMETGFTTLMYISSHLGLDFQFFTMSISVFYLASFGYFIYKYANNYYTSFILFMILGLYDFSFSGLRQTIAMGIILFAFDRLWNKKMWEFILLVLIAGLFHQSAFVLIILYPLVNIQKLYQRLKTYYVPIIVGIYLLSTFVANFLLNIYNPIYASGKASMSFNIFDLMIGGTLFFSYFLFKWKQQKDSYYAQVVFGTVGLTFLLQLLSHQSYLIMRFNYYLYPMFIILFSNLYPFVIHEVERIITDSRKKWVEPFFFANFFLFTLVFYHRYLLPNPHQILPFKFYWQ